VYGNGYFGASYFAETYYGPASLKTGGTTGAKKKKKKGLTEEEIEGLEAFGKAREGLISEELPTSIEEKVFILPKEIEEPVELELSLADLEPQEELISGVEEETETTEPDIALILAIIEATS